jgi:hypothetical protein
MKSNLTTKQHFNILDPDEFEYVQQSLVYGEQWAFNLKSNPDGNRFWTRVLIEIPFYSYRMDEKVRKLINCSKDQYNLVELFANGQPYGCPAQFHTDNSDESFVFYANEIWDPQWNGLTIFRKENGEMESVFPYPNSGIHFDSKIPHFGQEPSRMSPEMRVTIAFKYRKI